MFSRRTCVSVHKLNRNRQTNRTAKSPNVKKKKKKTDWKHNLNINLKEFLFFFLFWERRSHTKKKISFFVLVFFLADRERERPKFSACLISRSWLSNFNSNVYLPSSDLLSTGFFFYYDFGRGPFFTLRVPCNTKQKRRNTWNITHWRLSW